MKVFYFYLLFIVYCLDENLTVREAKPRAGELAIQMLSKLKTRIETQLAECRYPPKNCVSVASRYPLECVVVGLC